MTPKSKQAIKYAAFLRGINVGGNKLIKMGELKRAFEELGFHGTQTLLASGNVVFESEVSDVAKLTKAVEAQLAKVFGHEIGVLLRTVEYIRQLVDSQPFGKKGFGDDAKLYVSLFDGKGKGALKIPYESPQKDLRILSATNGEVYSVTFPLGNGRYGNSMTIIEKEFGPKVTTRNWNTIVKVSLK